MVRDDGLNLDFDWQQGSPSNLCGLNSDHFSVRWTRAVYFDAGKYTFVANSDDGSRVFIDDQARIRKVLLQLNVFGRSGLAAAGLA